MLLKDVLHTLLDFSRNAGFDKVDLYTLLFEGDELIKDLERITQFGGDESVKKYFGGERALLVALSKKLYTRKGFERLCKNVRLNYLDVVANHGAIQQQLASHVEACPDMDPHTKESLIASCQTTNPDALARFIAACIICGNSNTRNRIKPSAASVPNLAYMELDRPPHPIMTQQQSEREDNNIFVRFEKNNQYFQNYFRRLNHLFYPEHSTETYLSKLETSTVIVIKGRQGAGKTTLALNLAASFCHKNGMRRIMYTNISADWYHVYLQIQHTKAAAHGSHFIWIIDDIHKSAQFEQDIVNWPFSGDDKYIFITRNIDKTRNNPHKAESSKWDDECVIKLDINNITFAKYIYADPKYKDLTYRDAEKIFAMCGGELTLLENYKALYGTSISDHFGDEQKILVDAFSFYFPNFRFGIQTAEFENSLEMLVMGMLDVPIPPPLQNHTCNTILAQFCYMNIKGELEFEHSSIAELLFSCVVNYLQMDFGLIYEDIVRGISRKLVTRNARKEAAASRINTFIQSMLSYKFVLPVNRNRKASVDISKDDAAGDTILKMFAEYIAPSTWKMLLSDMTNRSRNLSLLSDGVRKHAFINAVINSCDYNFRFIYKVLPTKDSEIINTDILSNIRQIANKMDNCSDFILLLRSLDDGTSLTFLDMLDQRTILDAISNNDDCFYGFSCGLKYLHSPVLEKLAERIGVENIDNIILSASIPAIMQMLEFFSSKRQHLLDFVNINHKRIIEGQTVSTSFNVRRVCEIQERMCHVDPELLNHIDEAFTEMLYISSLENSENIQDLYDLLSSCSSKKRDQILSYLREHPSCTDEIISRAIESTRSIGTLNLSIKKLMKTSPEAFNQLDKLFGADTFTSLIAQKGTAPDMLRIIARSTQHTAESILDGFSKNSDLFSAVIQRTIDHRVSLGTIGLVLHDFDDDMLKKIESLFTAETYMQLCRYNGNLAVLIGIMQHSSTTMQAELATLLKESPKLRAELLNNTIEDEKKIGTFALCLKSLKEENEESLILFEQAIGSAGFMNLLNRRGNIIILSRFLQYMSGGMRKEFIDALKKNPMTCETIFENTFADGTSAGNFHFSLREMGRQGDDSLHEFESILGAQRYLRIICDLGNLTVLFQILQYSSPEFIGELIREVGQTPDARALIIGKTIEKRTSIRAIALPMRELNKKRPDAMELLDSLIGSSEWLRLFTTLGDLSTLLSCLSEMSAKMRIAILESLTENREQFDIIISNTVEGNFSLGILPLRIRNLHMCGNDEGKLLESLLTPDIFLSLMEKMGHLTSFIQTLGEFSPEYLKTVQRRDLKPLIDATLSRTISGKDALHDAHYGIRSISVKNPDLLITIEKQIGREGYKEVFLTGSSLLNTLRIAAYSTLSNEICEDLINDGEYFQILEDRDIYTTELSSGFETEMYASVVKRLDLFEKIVNDMITDRRWIELFNEKCDLTTFLNILRWFKGEKISRISNLITSDTNLLEEMCEKWRKEPTSDLQESKFTGRALDVIAFHAPTFACIVKEIIVNR